MADLLPPRSPTDIFGDPIDAHPLWFKKESFLKDTFDSEAYIADLRTFVPFDNLRSELQSHLSSLKHELVELINRDYADFVNLSTKLVDVDGAILRMRAPLMELRDKISQFRASVESSLAALQDGLRQRAEASAAREVLELLLDTFHVVSKVEKLIKELPSSPADWSNGDAPSAEKASLSNGYAENGTSVRETQSMLLERISSEMNRLKFYVAHAENMASGSTSRDDDVKENEVIRSNDIGWKHAYLRDPNNKSKVTCNYCQKEMNQGIYRVKLHLAQLGGNVAKCRKVPLSVRDEIRAYLSNFKKRKNNHRDPSVGSNVSLQQEYNMEDDDEEADMVILSNTSGSGMGRPARRKGPMDQFLSPDPAEPHKKKYYKQPTIESKFKKDERKKVVRYIARWLYQAGIALNTTKLKSFKTMIEVIGQFGPGLKPPSYHELRVPLLKEEVKYTNEILNPVKESWPQVGVSIMSDGWTDRRNRTLINFLVNSPSGTIFLESVDASSYMKTAQKTFELLDEVVERVGEKNVVQVITDNASNYVAAGKMLMEKWPYLYWTPCSAHCIDLMLEDIGGLPKVKTLIKKATMLTGFIYNHGFVLNLMRKHTHNADIVRPAVTRFATSFLTLQSIYKKKDALRKVFISDEWLSSKWPRDTKGAQAENTVLSNSFWNGVLYALKISAPLVRVLRLVDGEKVPAMGYIYEAMDRAKESIKIALEEKETQYLPIWKIIDTRWDKQLHRPLHAAGYFLNPQFFYDNKVENDKEVVDGMHSVIQRLSLNLEQEDLLFSQLALYMYAEGNFGSPPAIRQRNKLAPVKWWRIHGSSAPELKELAIKILSLTCSASGCERNWSVFEHNLPFIKNMDKRIQSANLLLDASLGRCFIDALEHQDANAIYNCLRAYAAIDNAMGAEEIFRTTIISPLIQQITPNSSSDVAIGTSEDELEEYYQQIMTLIDRDCKFLLEISFSANSGLHVFNFLGNSILREVLSAIQKGKPGAFSPGKPAEFLKNYKASLAFLCYLEGYCPSRSSVSNFRSEAVYAEFMKQWNIGVYFSLRFHEIAGALDSALMMAALTPLQNSHSDGDISPELTLKQSLTLLKSLRACWREDVLIISCSDKFLRLSLQLIARYSTWLSSGLNARKMGNTGSNPGTEWAISAVPEDFIYVMHDIDCLVTEIGSNYLESVLKLLSSCAIEVLDLVKWSILQGGKTLKDVIPLIMNTVRESLVEKSVEDLRQLKGITATYRMTNKPPPTRHSPYVSGVLRPMKVFLEGERATKYLTVDARNELLLRATEEITDRFYELASDLVNVARKTESSLQRIRQGAQRRAGASSDVSDHNISDTDKICMQLFLDIQEYGRNLAALGVSATNIASYCSLWQCVAPSDRQASINF